jgi:hypothetical protein
MEKSSHQLTRDQQVEIIRKRAVFIKAYNESDWQSWNYDDSRLARAVR